MQTNGQDQSVALQRERELLPREPSRENLLANTRSSEASGPPRSQLADFELLPAILRHEGLAQWRFDLERQGAWNLGIISWHEIEQPKYPTGYQTSSREKPTGLAEGFKKVCERWSLDALDMAKLMHLEEELGLSGLILSGQIPPLTGDLKDRMAFVIGISIGLGELFNDDKDAELRWLSSARSELGSLSPLEHMLKGDLLNIRDVIDLVDNARGLG